MPEPRLECRDCGESLVVCDRCVDDDDVASSAYPLTSEARRVFHIGICPYHGALARRCPRCVPTHLIEPVDNGRVGPSPEIPDRIIRAGMVCLLVGFVAGVLLTLLLLPQIAARMH